jgi:hypothetical protein
MRPLTLCLPVFALAACGGGTAQRPAPVTPAVVAQAAPAPTPPTPRAPRWTPRQGPSLEALLRVHRAWAPSPSPDGRRVVFLSDASGLPLAHTAEVGAAPAAETAWTRLLESTERVQYASWAPGAAGIFFGQDTGGDENTRIHRIVPGQAAAALTPAGVKTFLGTFNTRGTALAFTSNERDRGAFDVYVRNTVGDAPARRVMETTGHYEAQDFSADGRTLAVVEERGSFDTDVHLVPAAGGPSRRITTHTGDVRWMTPRFSRDGRALFVITDEGREFMNLAVLPLNGPANAPRIAPTFLHEEAHDVDLFEVSREASVMAAVLNVDGYSQLRLYNLATAAPLTERPRPQLPPGNIGSMHFTQNGAALFVSLGRAVSPDEVWRVDTRTGAATQVTAATTRASTERASSSPPRARARASTGSRCPVFLYRPEGPAPGERAPVVVWVHGGPESQFTPYFSQVIQYLVGHGYIVAAPNVRGSTGYGKRYAHLDDVALREDSVRDLGTSTSGSAGATTCSPTASPSRRVVRRVHGARGAHPAARALGRGCDIVGIANFRTFLERTASVPPRPARGRVRQPRPRRRGARPGVAHPPGGPHPRAALRHPRRQRPAGARARGRADRGGAARRAAAGGVRALRKRGARDLSAARTRSARTASSCASSTTCSARPQVLSISAVGSLREEIVPGHLVVVDQFIDRTRQRASTFFDEGVVAHVSVADPVCPVLARAVAARARGIGATVHEGGTYVCIEGPRFSTRAESHTWRAWNASVVGMTNVPEAFLARECELPYATLALATDYDCWREHDEVDVSAILAVIRDNVSRAQGVVRALAEDMPDVSASPAHGALRHAVMTAPSAITDAQRARYALLLPHLGRDAG